MAITVSQIVEALASLGGQAHLDEIEARVIEISPPPHPKYPGASIRARMQERCREASSYKEGWPDLFHCVYGVNARQGVWALKSDPLNTSDPDFIIDPAQIDVSAEEWRANLRIHLRRERSQKLVNAFKALLSSYACEACGEDMGKIYGALGEGYIEAHHKVPVALIEEGTKTRVEDLAALCANCHRVIHRNQLMTVSALQAHLQKMRKEACKKRWRIQCPP